MALDLSRFKQTFIEEAREHIGVLEQGLLALEDPSLAADAVQSVFRAAHSIKGGAASLGFEALSEFTHHLESTLDSVRSGHAPVTRELSSLLLRATDLLTAFVDALEANAEPPEVSHAFIAELIRLSNGEASGTHPALPEAPCPHTNRTRYFITIEPEAHFFRSGLDPSLLFRDLARLGELSELFCDTSRVPLDQSFDPEACYVRWSLTLTTTSSLATVREIFVFVEDDCTLSIEPVAPPETQTSNTAEPLSSTRAATPQRKTTQTTASSVLRIPAAKVDSMIDLVGELVISQAVVRQLLAEHLQKIPPVLQDAVDSIDRNMQELQTRVMGIRMVPVSSIFSRFPRVVHDLSRALEKEVELELSGADTEIDKDVVEQLTDPLTHLVRNSLDHGIELPAVREAAGKPRTGRIHLAARHVAGGVVIEVSDDGRGLDLEKIRAKAEARGLITPDAVLEDEVLRAMIFSPGFSTAETVTAVSGRGVGLDAVRSTIDALSGSIAIESTPSHGTSFVIKLPSTRAILDGLTLMVGAETFVVPLLAITESFCPTSATLRTIAGKGESVMLRGRALPLLRLSQLFGIPNARTDLTRCLVVVVEADGQLLGLVVDSVNGQAQIVVKNLDTRFARTDGILGATILGSGRVSLILDVPALLRLSHQPLPSGGSEAA